MTDLQRYLEPLSKYRGADEYYRRELLAQSVGESQTQPLRGISPTVIPGVDAEDAPLLGHQKELMLGLTNALLDSRLVMASMPTGSGKTRTGVAEVAAMFQSGDAKRAVWLAPSVELVVQAHAAFERFWNDGCPPCTLRVGEYPIRPSRRTEFDVSVGTIQGAVRKADDLRRMDPDIVVVDEAHQASARSYRRLIEGLRATTGARFIGLSATPGRSTGPETQELVELFNNCIVVPSSLVKDPIGALRAHRVLARL